MAWPGRRWERFASGDPWARRPPARAVRPAPPPAAGRLGAAAVRGGRAGPRPPAAADHRRADCGQQPGDRNADRSRLRRPGAGHRHLLAAVPGRAVGLLQLVTPADPVPRRPHRVADVRAGHRRFRVLGHRRLGHRQRPGGVGDRAGRGSSRSACRPRPDPDPAGEGLRLHPAGADPVRHRRPRPQHPRRPVPPARARRHESRQAAAAAPGRHLAPPGRPPCSNSAGAGCSMPPLAARSSCSAPVSATRSRKAPWSPTCTAAMPATRQSWARW